MICLQNLTKRYDAGMVHALRGISLEISTGEICSIMGPSGSGKSTLLNMIGALDRPTSGDIIIEGSPLESYSPARYRNRMVGFVFQLHNLLPHLTLVENVALPLVPRRDLSQRQRQTMAMERLDEVGLGHRTFFYPARVSVGERQRAAVARALVHQPGIILADEPTGSVDSKNATLIMDAILQRSKNYQMTALIATHNPEIAKRTGRMIYMHDGRLVKTSPNEIVL